MRARREQRLLFSKQTSAPKRSLSERRSDMRNRVVSVYPEDLVPLACEQLDNVEIAKGKNTAAGWIPVSPVKKDALITL